MTPLEGLISGLIVASWALALWKCLDLLRSLCLWLQNLLWQDRLELRFQQAKKARRQMQRPLDPPPRPWPPSSAPQDGSGTALPP